MLLYRITQCENITYFKDKRNSIKETTITREIHLNTHDFASFSQDHYHPNGLTYSLSLLHLVKCVQYNTLQVSKS